MFIERDSVAEAILFAVMFLVSGILVSSMVWATVWAHTHDTMIQRGFTTHKNVIYIVEPMKVVED